MMEDKLRGLRKMEMPEDMQARIRFYACISAENQKEDSVADTVRMRRPVRKFSSVAVAAVLIFALSMTAAAATGLLKFKAFENPDNMVDGFYGNESIQSGEHIVKYDEDGKLAVNLYAWERIPVDKTVSDELVAPYICAVNMSGTYKDNTVTVEANLYDPVTQIGIVYYTVENPNGVKSYSVAPNGELSWLLDGDFFVNTNQYSRAYIDNAQTTDTKLYVCEPYTDMMGWQPDITVKFGSFYDAPADHQQISISYEQQEQVPGRTFGNAIDLSPIGMKIDCAALDVKDAQYIDKLVLKYDDGFAYTVYDDDSHVNNSLFSVMPEHGEAEYRAFNRIVDINRVTEVVINDVSYQ